MIDPKKQETNLNTHLYGPMLSFGSFSGYSRQITEGLWTILGRAQYIAKTQRDSLIKKGKDLQLEIRGDTNKKNMVTFVIYHVPFNKNADKSIGSFDIPEIDHSKIKHEKLMDLTISAIKATVPDSRIILCTTEEFGNKFKGKGIDIIIPQVEKERPMYYRVRTYNTLVQNDLISDKTIFLDSDAIVLKNPSRLFEQLGIGIGVTARFAPNLMPINEGVIFCNGTDEYSKEFFAHYMGTYEIIKDDNIIKEITKNDLMRWRGGQLSLNAVCPGNKMVDYRDSTSELKILPCEIYNYAIRSLSQIEQMKKEGKIYIAHVKGKAKMEK